MELGPGVGAGCVTTTTCGTGFVVCVWCGGFIDGGGAGDGGGGEVWIAMAPGGVVSPLHCATTTPVRKSTDPARIAAATFTRHAPSAP